MTDPLLTSLCTICHVASPKYKCPRCAVRTCSLACIKKHKAWASCSGERDPTSFVPRDQLFTDVGVDHDYNFITKIERAKERYEKEVLAERADGEGLLSEKELRLPEGKEDRRFEKVWYGDQMVHEPVSREDARGGWRGRGRGGRAGGPGGKEPADRFDQNVRRRLRQHDIEVLTMPKGLSRQKENKTAWNRRTNTINWQVEWLLHDIDDVAGEDKSPRICHKSLDEKPLYLALARTLDWYRTQLDHKKRALEDGDAVDEEEQPPHKKRKGPSKRQMAMKEVEGMKPCQDSNSSTWPAIAYATQCTASGRWNQMSVNAAMARTKEEEDTDLAKLQFFLYKPLAKGNSVGGLMPLSSSTTLLDALSGRTVVEFPSIHVLAPGASLPKGLSAVSADKRAEPLKAQSEDEATTGRAPGRKDRGFEMGRGFERRGRGARGRGERGGRGGHSREDRHDHGPSAPGLVDEGEIAGEGEQVDNWRGYAQTADVEMDDASDHDAGHGAPYDQETPEEAESKPVGGLVDYGSDSE